MQKPEVFDGVEADHSGILGWRRLTRDQIEMLRRRQQKESAVLDVQAHAGIVQWIRPCRPDDAAQIEDVARGVHDIDGGQASGLGECPGRHADAVADQ